MANNDRSRETECAGERLRRVPESLLVQAVEKQPELDEHASIVSDYLGGGCDALDLSAGRLT